MGPAAASLAGVPVKTAFAFAPNDFAITADGSAVFTDNVGNLPLGVNRSGVGASLFCGHIKSLKFFPTRLSNAKLQELTA